MIKAIVRAALGQGQDQYFYERVANGFEWCRWWLEKHKAYHGLDLDDDVLQALREVCLDHHPNKSFSSKYPA